MTNKRCFFAGIISIAVLVITLGLCLRPGSGMDSLKVYIFSLVVFFLSEVIVYLVLLIVFRKDLRQKLLSTCFLVVGLCLDAYLIVGLLIDDTGYHGADVSWFFWHMIPLPAVSILFLGIAALGVYVFFNVGSAVKVGLPLKVYYAVMALLYSLTVVYPNNFAADVYHINAYYHPIYNIFYNTPYSNLSYGLYGHYELFYKLPMLLFGTSPVVISFVLGLIAVICALAVDYVVCSLTQSKLVRIISAFVMLVPTGAMFQNSAYQTTPHRVFFSILLIAYACHVMKSMNHHRQLTKREYVIGHVICALSVLWSSETGLVCMIGWAFFCFVLSLQNKTGYIKKGIISILISFVFCILDVAAALAVVNIYNICVGGGRYIRAFFSTFTNGTFLGHYKVPIRFANSPYIYIMIAGAAAIVFAISKTRFFEKDSWDKRAPLLGITGVLTLGCLTYYVIRAAYYGLLIAVPFAVILLSFYADSLRNTYGAIKQEKGITVYTALRFVTGSFCIAVLSILAFMGCTLPSSYAVACNQGKYSFMQLKEEARVVEETIPEDTYALGWGTDELYGLLGWDTNYHLFGTTDVLLDPEAHPEVYNLLIDEANRQDQILLNSEGYQTMRILNIDYTLAKELQFQGRNYGYFVKEEYEKMTPVDDDQIEIAPTSEISDESILDEKGIFSVILNSETVDFTKYDQVALMEEGTGALYEIDSNVVPYLHLEEIEPADQSKEGELEKHSEVVASEKLYARVDGTELDRENERYQLVVINNNDNTGYATGIWLY